MALFNNMDMVDECFQIFCLILIHSDIFSMYVYLVYNLSYM